jgi:hypothetical protein
MCLSESGSIIRLTKQRTGIELQWHKLLHSFSTRRLIQNRVHTPKV